MTQKYFQEHFGFAGNKQKSNDISSNVVSVLQAGAFFGALGSAPISSWIGRRYALMMFTVVFSVGAVSHPATLHSWTRHLHMVFLAVAPFMVTVGAPR